MLTDTLTVAPSIFDNIYHFVTKLVLDKGAEDKGNILFTVIGNHLFTLNSKENMLLCNYSLFLLKATTCLSHR